MTTYATDRLQLRRQNMGRVFNSRSGCMHAMHFFCYEAKRPNLKLKTRPKQLLSNLQLDVAVATYTIKYESLFLFIVHDKVLKNVILFDLENVVRL